MNGNAYTEDILEFGKEEEAEQMLQVLYSDEIRDKVISKFNLMEHYDIDPDSKYRKNDAVPDIRKQRYLSPNQIYVGGDLCVGYRPEPGGRHCE